MFVCSSLHTWVSEGGTEPSRCVFNIVANSGPPGVRSATPSNGDRLAHRHGQFCRSPSGLTPESSYGQGFSLSLFVRGVLVRGRVNRPASVYLNTHTALRRGKVPRPRLAPDTNRLNGSLRDRDNRAELSPTRTDRLII